MERVIIERPEEWVRIKKGVRPYGGRRARVVGRETYPNGRRVVRVLAPRDSKHVDIREYNEEEVEPIEPATT